MTAPGLPSKQVATHEILAILDNEVREAESDRQRRGWNAWIIAAALAALIWTGLSLYETTKVDLGATVRMWLVGVIVAAALRASLSALPRTGRASDTRFIIPSTGLWNREGLALPILGHVLVLAVLLWLSPTTPLWATIILFSVVAVTLLALIGGASILLLNFPLPAVPQLTSAVQYLLPCVLLAATGLGVWGLAAPLQFAGPDTPVPEFKLALVSLSMWYLAPIFFYEARPSWFLDRLRSLRRDVYFGELTPSEVLQRTESLLLGMKGALAADALLAPLTSTLVVIEGEEDEIDTALNYIRQLALQAQDRDAEANARHEFLRINGEVLARINRLEPLHRQLFARYDAVHRRVLWAQVVAPSLVPHANEALMAFAHRQHRRIGRREEFIAILQEMTAKYGGGGTISPDQA